MVLELKVPHGATIEALVPLGPVLLSYVLSFIYIGIYWNKHQYGSYPIEKALTDSVERGKIINANLSTQLTIKIICGEIMPEPVTAVGLGAIAAYLSKDGLAKILGPTADYLGGGLRDFTQQRVQNIGRIFASAEKKLGAKAETPGAVPPKVLKAVLDEGSYAAESIAVEYFGGILASSRTEQGRDDRGARLAKVLESLSTYQLRTHYLIYATVQNIFKGRGIEFNMDGRPKMQIFIPYSNFLQAMDFNEKEMAQIAQLLNHIFFGLSADDLIGGQWLYGMPENIKRTFAAATEGGIICEPSSLGAELFMSAFGCAEKPVEAMFTESGLTTIDGVPQGFISAVSTKL